MSTQPTEESNQGAALTIDERQSRLPLITIRDGREVIVTAGEDEERSIDDQAVRNALSVFGAWSDVDWDEAAEALDRIRHESAPIPPM